MTSQDTEKINSDSDEEKEEDGDQEEGEANMAEKSRWWDHYYVRYFVGSVFAVPLMLALSKAAAVKPLGDITGQDKFLNATVLGAAGLAFCYVAGAPILLLHTTRAQRSKPNRVCAKVGRGSIIFAIVILALAIALGAWIFLSLARPIETPTWLSFVPMAIVVVIQAVLILGTPTAAIVEFYQDLAKDRAEDPEQPLGRKRKEYITSYRDMREHGNALLILVMEGVLTAALLQATSPGVLLAMLTLWVMPAAFAWFIATALEAHLDKVT